MIKTTIVKLLIVLVAVAGLSGCTAANMGIRPDPPIFCEDATACDRYRDFYNATLELRESYHARASQNRWWVYVAGALALGTAAATGGLGAVGAAGTSIALLSISGGFSSGFFAVLNNDQLARIYTESANVLTDGLKDSAALLAYDTKGELKRDSCAEALATLEISRAKAQNDLESSRSDAAAAARIEAAAQVRQLNELVKTVQAESVKAIVKNATISGVTWSTKDKATVTIKGPGLGQIPDVDVVVKVAGVAATITHFSKTPGEGTTTVVIDFTPPEQTGEPTERALTVVFDGADPLTSKLPKGPST